MAAAPNTYIHVTGAAGAPYATAVAGCPPTHSVAYSSTAHHHHHHRHRPSSKKPSRYDAFCCGLEGSPSRRKRYKGARQYEFRDRTGLAVSIDSGDENDWDAPEMTKKVWGDRRGPMRERPVDDLLITMQDLFPCLNPLLDCCGCGRKRAKRLLPCKSECHQVGGPRLETVCLDCGNVIDSRNLPRTVNLDLFDRHDPNHHNAFIQGTLGERDNAQAVDNFEGYKEWTVIPEDHSLYTQKRTNYTPLPEFHAAPPRIFKNAPTGLTHKHTVDQQYGIDSTGQVDLPEFPM